MNDILHGNRVLIYSHDSFGLGHLRRCQTIARNLHYGLFNAPQGMEVSMTRPVSYTHLTLPTKA